MATNSTSGQPIPTQPVLTMQGALLALQNYWADRGCLLVQPFNTEVGAGTYNPATVLRVLGPEPWQVAYVEPSVRPDDARYGENPNRLQTHTQFQVILKPDPGNPQEVYLGSLEALGIDIRAHDIRFVEDNWASPALGAWGLGWEVWLDGLEITQFTYFQQAGGLSLDPVSVEITYGIERIIMALQGVDHFKDIQYSPGITYGEAFGQAEYEMSRYYLDDADIATNQRLFDEYAAEARRCLDAGLPVPAHTYVLKCSHAFNVLDSRGAISTTERARAFARMRGLAREVARLWSQRREELGHPLGVVTPPPLAKPALPASVVSSAGPATLLFEIGTEELPAGEVSRTAVAVRDALAKGLAGTRLGHGDVRTHSTPRRIVAVVGAVEPSEPDAVKTVRGPKAAAAFTADGEPTPAAAGFARGQKVDVADLQRIDVDGVEYVGTERTEHGRSAVQVLSAVLSDVVGGLRSERNMRWREPGMSFSRPIRWLVALLGDVVVPVTAGSMTSGRVTRVHRTAPEPTVEIPVADGYVERLAEHGIVADAEERRSRIVSGAQKLAASVGGTVNVDRDATDSEAGLLDEITNLVEEPTPILGGFEPRYLDLPAPILTTVMRKHQRYLPVRDTWGNLLPHFVAVANGACDHDVVRAGNEAVLRARYEDAAFFWRADLAIAPAQHKQALTKLTYAEGLGSMAERAERIAAIATDLAGSIALSEEERSTLARAAELTKFDLASHMVIELSSLAGVMAREYARQAGEPAEVAEALFEMELPRSAGDALPSTMPGALLALADRFELLAGLFATGANPTGSSDPFGLRRAALGAVSTLRAHHGLAPVTLRKGLEAAAAALGRDGVEVSAAALDEAHSFAVRRLEQQLLDAGADHRMVQAVLPLADVPSSVDATMAELTARSGDPQFGRLVAALQRVRRIVPAGTAAAYDPGVLVEPAELALHETVTAVRGQLSSDRSDLSEFVEVAGVLTDPINIFFDAVLVMAEDEALRAARLGLLATVAALAEPVLDWQALGSQ